MPKSKEVEPTFEALASELESIVARLEAGNLPLDESLTLFQRGMEIAALCSQMLDKAELRIKELVPQNGGDPAVQDFDGEL